MKMLYKIILITNILLITVACNTVNGIGKDVSQGGKAIERAAR